MALRTVALCNGKYIGIESIFTVIDGKQINIPEKLSELRRKSQNDELFCPCGCGANYILVAGDKNLREQHFRIKDGQNYENCSVVTEGRTSVDSKIVLKCWLDDNLHADDLESRVPICSLSYSNRKYEFTFISRSCGIALDYCHSRLNLSEEKQAVLEENSNGITIIHVVDIMNGGSNGQYPECLMKVQEKQKYCLLLSVEDADYDTAEMKAVFYEKDLDGLWPETVFADGMLKEYQIDRDGSVLFKGASLDELYTGAKKKFKDSMVSEKERREKAKKQIEEQIKQIQAEAERKREEAERKKEELAEKNRILAEEAQKKRAEQEEKQRIEIEKEQEERRLRDEDFKKNLESNFEQQEKRVIDADGKRWFKCEFCGKIAMEAEFPKHGGPGRINLGTCNDCYENNPAVKEARETRIIEDKKKYDPAICPDCGGKLREVKWRGGAFIGCSNFPGCRYTRSNW
jgi:hypothetical protein